MAGGLISSERREAYANFEKAEQQEILMERKIKQQIKSSYSAVLTNLANVKAREQALKSSESALRATQFGYESGELTGLTRGDMFWKSYQTKGNARIPKMSSLEFQ